VEKSALWKPLLLVVVALVSAGVGYLASDRENKKTDKILDPEDPTTVLHKLSINQQIGNMTFFFSEQLPEKCLKLFFLPKTGKKPVLVDVCSKSSPRKNTQFFDIEGGLYDYDTNCITTDTPRECFELVDSVIRFIES